MPPKPKIISVRLAEAVFDALTERAQVERQPITRMASLLIEDGVRVSRLPADYRDGDPHPDPKHPTNARSVAAVKPIERAKPRSPKPQTAPIPRSTEVQPRFKTTPTKRKTRP